MSLDKLKNYKIGFRTIKTGIAVALSLYIAKLFNLKSPIFVGIGAIMAMQSTVSESFKSGKDRMLGTIVGASIGLVFSYLFPNNYIFLGIGIILVIHIHNIMDWKSSLTLSAIVLLAIILNSEGSRISYSINRVIDTFVGIAIAVLVNYFVAAPNVKQTFLNAKTQMYNKSRDLVYNVLTKRESIVLEDFFSELKSLEETFILYKSEVKLDGLDSDTSDSYTSVLMMMDSIYHDLFTILKLDIEPVLNEKNAEIFECVYEEKFVNISAEDNPISTVYNYHMNNILKNLIEIYNILKRSSEI